ncbi:MAG: cupin domain-containing protein, partial [Ruminiclostridium sp.]|nr:cupin domain-containing protein [Ruminiclostridium sp.]
QEYIAYDTGAKDLSHSVLNSCAEAMGIERIELLTGSSPTLRTYSLVRKGEGLPIERRIGFTYQHMAYLFKNKKIEPIMVHAPFEPDLSKPIAMSVHEGQEMNFIIKGKLKFVIGNNTEILNEGDCIYYDSSNPHGMIAIDGECDFLAILI